MIPMAMKTAGVAELKARLSEYLTRVRAGEEVLVTDRGRPVARLVPAGSGDRDSEEAGRLAELERAGLLRLAATSIPDGFWEAERPADAGAATRAALLDERRSGR
jgi:prevent-host-death family protein